MRGRFAMASNKKGKKHAIRTGSRKRKRAVAQKGAGAPANHVAQKGEQAPSVGAVHVVLDNSIPGGFRMEPV